MEPGNSELYVAEKFTLVHSVKFIISTVYGSDIFGIIIIFFSHTEGNEILAGNALHSL